MSGHLTWGLDVARSQMILPTYQDALYMEVSLPRCNIKQISQCHTDMINSALGSDTQAR